LPEGLPSVVDVNELEMLEEGASVGMFQNEDVLVCVDGLLIGFITLKCHIFSVSETLDHISMMDGLQELELIAEVALLFGVLPRYNFQDHPLFLPVRPHL
jgi:hypothetical protein